MKSLHALFLAIAVLSPFSGLIADNTGPSPVVWFEIATADVKASSDFYSKLFGWKIGKVVDGMAMIEVDGKQAGGLTEATAKPSVGPTTIYFNVKALKPALKQSIALGAKQVLAPMALPDGHGYVAVFQDKQNALIGLFSEKLE